MEGDLIPSTPQGELEASIAAEMDKHLGKSAWLRYGRFVMAAMSSIPWIGGLLGASVALHAEFEQDKLIEMQRRWLEEHQRKLDALGTTVVEMLRRFQNFGEEAEQRLHDESYLKLVSQGFRTWDNASTEEKRRLVQQLLTNAAGTRICSDDVVRLFLDWIERYHEAHFAIIRDVFRNPGVTRRQIWNAIHDSWPRDDSAEADLFRLLIHDLNVGRVIRQHRETNAYGQFRTKRTKRKSAPGVLKSAFDDAEPYELTELGKQFVHYTMTEAVPRFGGQPKPR